MIEEKINAKGNTCWDVRKTATGPILGTVFSTSLPTLSFEAFSYCPSALAHRCETVEDGERWILDRVVTVSELQALPDTELNALAAKLRGWKLENGRYWEEDGSRSTSEMRLDRWTPATSRDQSGALLQWAATQGCYFTIGFGDFNSEVRVRINLERNEREIFVDETIPGNDARAETIAFCVAMLAMETQNRPAPKS